MSARLALLALIGSLGLTACGGDDEIVTDAGPSYDAATIDNDAELPPPSLDELCNETDGLYVDFFGTAFECQAGLFELIFGTGVPSDAELSALCEGALSPYLDDGTVELGDRDAFSACAAFLADLDCEDFSFDSPNPCDDVIVGTIAEGGTCDSSDQCIGDAYCDTSAVTCGECTAKLANDEVCVDSAQCLSGYCKEIEAGDDICAPLGVNGDDCDSSQDCLGSRVCNTSGTCESAPASWSVDDPCTTFIFDCGGPGSDLYCHPVSQTCKEWLAIDDSCPAGDPPAALCDWFSYESCQGSAGSEVCTAPTIATNPGDACGFMTGVKCDTGMLCDIEAGVCKTVVSLGGDCSGANTTCEFLIECVDDSCQYGSYTGMCPAP